MIAQAWAKHEKERLRTSWGPRKIHQTMVAEHEAEMRSFVTDEIFVQPMFLAHSSYALAENHEVSENAKQPQNVKFSKYADKPFLTEVYTNSQNVTKEAERRGHRVGDAPSLETGWNFLIPSHRGQALQKIKTEKPYCVVCFGFSMWTIQPSSETQCQVS